MSGKSNSEQNDVKLPGEDSKDKIYEPKQNKKIIRLLTVIAYVFAVSLAAIMLSLYYVFLWNPDMPKLSGRRAPQDKSAPYSTAVSIATLTVAPSGFEEPRSLPLEQKFSSHIDADTFSSRVNPYSDDFESQIRASPSSETQYQYDTKSSVYMREHTDLDEPRVMD